MGLKILGASLSGNGVDGFVEVDLTPLAMVIPFSVVALSHVRIAISGLKSRGIYQVESLWKYPILFSSFQATNQRCGSYFQVLSGLGLAQVCDTAQ